MRFQKIHLTLMLAFFVICSCTKDTNDFNDRRSNIIGDWEVEQTLQEIRSDTVYNEIQGQLKISVFEDGNGIKETSLEKVPFQWIYQYNPEKIVIKEESGNVFNQMKETKIFDVIKNDAKSQNWIYEDNRFEVVTQKYIHIWELSKIE